MSILAKHVGIIFRVVFLGIICCFQAFPTVALTLPGVTDETVSDLVSEQSKEIESEAVETVKEKAVKAVKEEVATNHQETNKEKEAENNKAVVETNAQENNGQARVIEVAPPSISSDGEDDVLSDDQDVKIIVADKETYGDYDVESLTPEQAYSKGRLLRAQFRNSDARVYLKYAADKQYADAAYLYAIELMKYNVTVRTPDKSREYLESSAQLGNLHAMRYLYKRGDWLRPRDRNTWKKKYHDSLIAFADSHPGEATYLLSLFFQNSVPEKSAYYLNRSIGYGYPLALMEQARREQRSGSPQQKFSTDGSRDPNVLRIYKQAAMTGYIPAIKACVELYEARGDFQEAFRWRLEAIKAGDLTSLFVVAKIYASEAASYRFVAKDLIKARAFSELYLDFAGDDRFTRLHRMAEQFFVDVTEQLTPPEISEADVFVSDYKGKTIFYNHDVYWDL